MFSPKNTATKSKLSAVEAIYLALSASLFLISCLIYSFKGSILFPLLNSLLLLSTFFVFKGKYRLYALFFAIPFIIFFNYKSLGVGSFFSYSIIVYSILIVIELLLCKRTKNINPIDIKRVIIVLFLVFYSIILTLINSGFNGVIKTVSIFAYFLAVSFFFFDFKAKKDFSILILTISISLLAANILAYFILFVIKGDTAVQFLERFMSRAYAIHYQANNASFRFPGLTNDPNYLGFYTLLLASIVIISFKNLRFKIPIAITTISLQIFPLIGQSKNYFLAIIILMFALIIVLLKKKHGLLVASGVLFVGLLGLLIFGNSILLPTILRFLNIDARDGFLNAITTGRTTIQLMYFNEYITHPVSFLFGRGFNSLLSDASAHSVYVMTFWYFGIVGTVIYYYWISAFFPIKQIKRMKRYFAPLLIMLICALSLDYISYSEMFLFVLYLAYLSIGINSKNNHIESKKEVSNYYEIDF